MSGSGYRVREARLAKGWTQAQLADKLHVTQQAVTRYENGDRDLKSSTILDLSKVLGVTVSYLLGVDDVPVEHSELQPVDSSMPLVGRIAAGTPREAIQLDQGKAWCPPPLVDAHPHAFFLEVRGDSMNLMFPDGCLVLIDPDDHNIANGHQYAVLVNGFDATVKTCYRVGATVVLHPESSNPIHKDFPVAEDDEAAPFFQVIGRVVWFSATLSER